MGSLLEISGMKGVSKLALAPKLKNRQALPPIALKGTDLAMQTKLVLNSKQHCTALRICSTSGGEMRIALSMP